MDNIGVYQITVNGKKYIGSASKGFKKRWSCHLGHLRKGVHANTHLQRAYNKYGEEALIFSILEIVETPEECIIIEQKYIDELKPEYNMCPLARSSFGLKHTEKAKHNMKLAQQERVRSNYYLGHIVSEETRKKLSESHKGQWYTKAALGIKRSEETKRKMSEAHKGQITCHSEEQRKKQSESLKKYWSTIVRNPKKQIIKVLPKNRIITNETRKKMSESMKNAWANGKMSRTLTAETRCKMSEAKKKSWIDGKRSRTFTEEHKQNLSKSIKRSWEKRIPQVK